MQKVSVKLTNCYGIGKLDCEFDFSSGRVHAVYAPNGVMKTSLAKTLADISKGQKPSDQMVPSRPTGCQVTDEHGVALKPEEILVIPPYEANYQPKEVSTLLVHAELKRRYDEAVAQIEAAKKALLSALKTRSGVSGRNVTPESELALTFGVADLLTGLQSMCDAADVADAGLADVAYGTLFDDKAVQFLKSPTTLARLDGYVKQYDDLVSKSPILTREFTHTQAGGVHKSLVDAKFFDAKHWITLNDNGTEVPIHGPQEFKERLESELNRVLSDPGLRKAFDDFDAKIANNKELRALREYLQERPHLIARLSNLDRLKRDVWAALLAAERGLLDALRDQYQVGRAVIEQAITEARNQATEWSAVVDGFNQRFCVPFRLAVANQDDVILKEKAPRVQFEFRDADATTPVSSDAELLRVLSQGERRALYLLNVLFDIRAKAKAGNPVLVVADDIADSFDYRNKYAIIEYLHDVEQLPNFRLIILTHNFDFHRSAGGRLHLPRQNRRLAVRSGRDVSLVADKYQRNPLTHWLEHTSNSMMFLASVPFIRNLAEYCGHDDAFQALTEVLHIKPNTKNLTLADLDREFAKLKKGYAAPTAPTRTDKVFALLESTAATIARGTDVHVELEAKVILSIAIRLKAEEHMIGKINDTAFVLAISADQTKTLLAKYRVLFPTAKSELAVLDQVQLMTPENIHLNSFMFEPILDLGIDHLRNLYRDVAGL